MVSDNGFPPTEQNMIAVLGDGEFHDRKELHACMGPSSARSVKFHLSNIRKKLRARGRDILYASTGFRKPMKYRMVQLITTGVSDE